MATSRVRTRDATVPHQIDDFLLLCNGTESTTDDGSDQLLSGETQITTDVVTPNFQQQIAKGKIINNPFHSVKTEHGFSVNTYRYKRKTSCSCNGTALKEKAENRFYGISQTQNYLLANNNPDSQAFREELAQLSNVVQTQAIANIVPAEVEALVDIAEWRKTFRLIRHPLNSVQEYLKKVRRSKRYKRSTVPDLGTYISNEWLKYRYGLMPLTMSIEGALKASLAPRIANRVSARSTAQTSVHSDLNVDLGTAWAYNRSMVNDSSIVGTVRAGILYDHEFTKNDVNGMSLHEIPAAIWEIIPFSFVVDWFVNAESFIRAVTPKADVRRLAEYTTIETVTKRKTTVSYTWNAPNCFTNVVSPGGYFESVVTEKTRSPGVSAHLSSKLKSINFEAPKDWIHLADSIALILSSLKYR